MCLCVYIMSRMKWTTNGKCTRINLAATRTDIKYTRVYIRTVGSFQKAMFYKFDDLMSNGIQCLDNNR